MASVETEIEVWKWLDSQSRLYQPLNVQHLQNMRSHMGQSSGLAKYLPDLLLFQRTSRVIFLTFRRTVFKTSFTETGVAVSMI